MIPLMKKALPSEPPPRREPKTQRGRDTREEILRAAQTLLSERSAGEVPFTELAMTAGVARASLLHAFPHWRDVLFGLFLIEIDRLDASFEAAESMKRASPTQKAYAMLVPLLDRAEKTGYLYPNIRSAMFTWHGEPIEEDFSNYTANSPDTPAMLGTFLRIALRDHYGAVEELLRVPADNPAPVGELLVNFTLDLAASSPSDLSTFDERRQTLRHNIELIAAGLNQSKRSAAKSRRT